MTQSAISFGNTIVPLAILAMVAAIVPYLLTPRATRSQGRVALAIGLTALGMVGLSGLIFALFDTRDLPQGGAAGRVLIGWFYIRSALGAVAVWGPVLALVWLSLAQRVERLRGADMAQRGR